MHDAAVSAVSNQVCPTTESVKWHLQLPCVPIPSALYQSSVPDPGQGVLSALMCASGAVTDMIVGNAVSVSKKYKSPIYR